MSLFKRAKPVPEPALDLVSESFRDLGEPSGPYQGRLAFDSDSGFHLAESGHKVVTHDYGKTWVYAGAEESSHQERYQERVKTIDSTANKHTELALEHGLPRADELVEPHHFAVQSNDLHHGQVMFVPDRDARAQTSHTDTWSEE